MSAARRLGGSDVIGTRVAGRAAGIGRRRRAARRDHAGRGRARGRGGGAAGQSFE